MTHAPYGASGHLRATWRFSLGKRPYWLWQPHRHMVLGSERVRAQLHVYLYNNVCYKYYFCSYNLKCSYQKYYYLCYKYYYFYYNSKYWYKNIIICVVIILKILNIIIYVINIIIFIIINIINKIINKFEKNDY